MRAREKVIGMGAKRLGSANSASATEKQQHCVGFVMAPGECGSILMAQSIVINCRGPRKDAHTHTI